MVEAYRKKELIMARIVIDARIINSSTGRYVERLVHYLEEIDHENKYTVLVPTKDLGFYQPKNKNFSVQAADFKNYSFAEQIGFLKLLNSLKADLVHFCMPQQPLLYRGKKITTVHDLTLLKTWNSDKNWLVYHFKQMIGRYLFWKIGRTNEFIITPTRYTQDEYLKFAKIPKSKVLQFYEAADVHPSKTKPYKLPFNKFIMYVGQQPDFKNIRRLGGSHQKLLKKHPELGLVLVGRLNEAAKRNQWYFESKNYKNILFTDFISDEQRDWLYQNCQAYIFPSLMEGFGLPGLEAMTRGTPVVSSNATCLPEVYGEAAHYFDPENVEDMAEKIDRVLSDKKLRSSLISSGFKQVKKYSWRRMTEQTLEVYKKTLDSK